MTGGEQLVAADLTDQAATVDAVAGRRRRVCAGRTQSLTNTAVFDRIRAGKRPLVPLNAHPKPSLMRTPDASRALALFGNTKDAFGQTWHLPIDQHRQT